jgi:3-dehydroquinate synthase
LLHGEAVAIGMVCASQMAERRGLVAKGFTLRLKRLLVRLRLPVKGPVWPMDDLLRAMRTDKKAVAGRLRFVLPRRFGEVALYDDISDDEVRDTISLGERTGTQR